MPFKITIEYRANQLGYYCGQHDCEDCPMQYCCDEFMFYFNNFMSVLRHINYPVGHPIVYHLLKRLYEVYKNGQF